MKLNRSKKTYQLSGKRRTEKRRTEGRRTEKRRSEKRRSEKRRSKKRRSKKRRTEKRRTIMNKRRRKLKGGMIESKSGAALPKRNRLEGAQVRLAFAKMLLSNPIILINDIILKIGGYLDDKLLNVVSPLEDKLSPSRLPKPGSPHSWPNRGRKLKLDFARKGWLHYGKNYMNARESQIPEMSISDLEDLLNFAKEIGKADDIISINNELFRRRELPGPVVEFLARQESETPVMKWFRSIGLGRVAKLASASELYCDMESFQDMKEDDEAKKTFIMMMKMNEDEKKIFLSALSKLP
jgi:hypothetical protein